MEYEYDGNDWNGGQHGHPLPPSAGPWEPAPRWMFWRPTMRRWRWGLNRGKDTWLRRYEYQHPAFVAREALAKQFLPSADHGVATQAPWPTDL